MHSLEKTCFGLPPQFLARPSLQACLDEGLRKRLVLLVAPPGYGKSTALADAVTRVTRPVLWYTFDSRDVSVAPLTRTLAARLGALTDSTLPFPLSPDATPLDCAQFLARCVEQAAPKGALLVFDGLDQSPSEAAATSLLQYLLDLGPRKLRIAATSATRPDLDLSSVAGTGELARIGEERLRYADLEVAQLLVMAWGPGVPESLVRVVCRLTGGWPAGLSLFLMAYPERPSSADVVLSAPGTSAPEAKQSGILERMSEADRELLYVMALCPVIRAADVEELTGRSGAARRIRRLVETASAFRAVGDDHHVMFPAVRDHLAAAAEREWGPAKLSDCRRRVAGMVERKGELEQALSLFLELRDSDGVNRVLRTIGVPALQDWDAARAIAISSKLEALPELGPEGLLLCARSSGARGDRQACDRYCTAALEKVDRSRDPRLFLALSAIQTTARSVPRTDGSAEALWKRVREQLQAAGTDRGWFGLWFGSFLVRTGRLREGEEELGRALLLLREEGRPAPVGWALNRLADVQIKRGLYGAALPTLRQAFPISRRAGMFQAMVNRYLFAQVTRLQGMLQEAREHLTHALELATLANASLARFSFQLLLMELALWREEMESARHRYEEAESIIPQLSAGLRAQHSLQTARGRLAWAMGAEDDACEAFKQAMALEAESEHESAWNALHAGLFFLRTQDHDLASQALAKAVAVAERTDATHLRANTLLVRAGRSHSLGHADSAHRDVARFWREVQLRGYRFMPVSDNELVRWAEVARLERQGAEQGSPRVVLMTFPSPRGGGLEDVGDDATPPGHSLAVKTLGPLRLYVYGKDVGEDVWRANLKGKRLFELLLSSRSFQVSADEAVEALWPAAPPHRGRHRLHMAVTRLRKTLHEIGAGDLIEMRYEHSFYRLVLDENVSIDHTTFQSLAERGLAESGRGRHRRAYDLLTAAVRLHTGVFLEDALYERFTDFRRDHLSDLLGKAIHGLGSSPLISRQEALQWWGKALEHDCYDESAYRAALECCSELGLHGKALAYYSMMNHHLVEELGIPKPEWAETFVALAQQSCAPQSP